MADPADYRKVRDDDPERCQLDNAFGQCSFARVEGSNYCLSHSAASRVVHKANVAANRSYNLQRWNARIGEFVSSPSIKTLREEIGIARMSLESILDTCKDSFEIQLNSNKINQMLERIEKLVTSCDRLETKMLLTLDKSAAILLADEIIQILTEEVQDSEVIERVSEKIALVMTVAGNNKLNGPRN